MRDRYTVRPVLRESQATETQLALFPLSPRLRRVWFPYHRWEEYKAGMWRTVGGSDQVRLLGQMITFTGNAQLYGEAMREVIAAWPISCALNLTTIGMNRCAWIGHAACAFKHAAPEHVVREAWHYLSQQQQDDANEQAEIAIRMWEHAYG